MNMRARYMRALARVGGSRGTAGGRWRSRASKIRKRMIASNGRRNKEDRYKRLLGQAGPKALKKFRQFWGVSYPGSVKAAEHGKDKKKLVLVGMGHSPFVVLADGPQEKATRTWKDRKRRVVATDPSGKRIFVVDPSLRKPIGRKLKFAGYAPATHYIPFRSVEKAGSFKKNRHWIHEHSDEGGKWPKVYRDSSGNYVYGRGTYSVNKWIRR